MSSLISLSGEMIPEAQSFRNSLRADEQPAFDELYQAAQDNIKLMGDVGLVIPLEKLLFAMLIEQQKQIDNLKTLLGSG